jgi:hypothetical protein
MEFDLARWRRQPTSRWLVKLVDDHVYAGTIHAFNDAGVVVHAASGSRHVELRDVDWIRPLIEICVEGWSVLAGFQAEDTTFDTWWIHDEILVCINYSAPTGFSDLLQVISPHEITQIRAPSPAALAQARVQIHRLLIESQHQSVPPIAHLQ